MDRRYLWFITPKTNLHVGDENVANFALVDKMVQRDVLTTLPCIHSSSLKGALSEFVSAKLMEKEDKNRVLKSIFGSDNDNPADSQKGTHTFFDAHLLFLPVPSDHGRFYLATSPSVIDSFIAETKLFYPSLEDIHDDTMNRLKSLIGQLRKLRETYEPRERPAVFLQNSGDIRLGADYSAYSKTATDLEGCEGEIKALQERLKNNIALFSDDDFAELCDDQHLPIIARNKLDKGESKNLWYEQVIPRESVFYTFILEKGKESLKEQLLASNDWVQIGANATIGYGYCEFKENDRL